MLEFIRDAGWGIFPVMAFGAVALIVSVWFAVKRERSQLALVVGFSVATMITGLFATVLGLQTTVEHVGKPGAEHWIFLVGLRESLNNMLLACMIVCAVALIATYGSFKRAVQLEAIEDPA